MNEKPKTTQQIKGRSVGSYLKLVGQVVMSEKLERYLAFARNGALLTFFSLATTVTGTLKSLLSVLFY